MESQFVDPIHNLFKEIMNIEGINSSQKKKKKEKKSRRREEEESQK